MGALAAGRSRTASAAAEEDSASTDSARVNVAHQASTVHTLSLRSSPSVMTSSRRRPPPPRSLQVDERVPQSQSTCTTCREDPALDPPTFPACSFPVAVLPCRSRRRCRSVQPTSLHRHAVSSGATSGWQRSHSTLMPIWAARQSIWPSCTFSTRCSATRACAPPMPKRPTSSSCQCSPLRSALQGGEFLSKAAVCVQESESRGATD